MEHGCAPHIVKVNGRTSVDATPPTGVVQSNDEALRDGHSVATAQMVNNFNVVNVTEALARCHALKTRGNAYFRCHPPRSPRDPSVGHHPPLPSAPPPSNWNYPIVGVPPMGRLSTTFIQ